jgi:hypothetical protein
LKTFEGALVPLILIPGAVFKNEDITQAPSLILGILITGALEIMRTYPKLMA